MALRLSIKEMIERVVGFKKGLNGVIAGLRATKREQEQIFARGGLASEVKDAVAARLVTLADNLVGIELNIGVHRANDASISWETIVRPGNPAIFHHFDIEVDNGGNAHLTFEDIKGVAVDFGSAPFTDGSTIEITKSSDATQNGFYIIHADSTAGTLIVLTGIMPGSDNSNETKMVLTYHIEA